MEEAVVNAGDTEVVDLMVARAQHFTRIGAWAEAKKEYNDLLARPKIVSSKKIDAIMTKCRIALFTADFAGMKDTIAEAKKLNETAGDWDRRNRLKVYEAMYLLAIRDVKQATPLLQSCIATFTSVEICTYNEFMFYALLTGVLHLPRTKLKKEIILNPQVISVIKDIEHMPTFVSSFYNCEYRDFFRKLLDVNERIANDRYMGPHVGYIQREFRVLAYSQFLEAYRSVTMSSMAASFGMPLPLLDTDLSHFIAAGRMTAKIDKVGDVIETSRPDKKNAQYQETIKKGDALLNQIQKLVRVVKV
jgi:26S proteasome regulatory subunit N7